MDTFIEQVELLVGTPGGTATTTRLTAKTKRYDGGGGGSGGTADPFSNHEKYQDAAPAEASPPSPPTGYKRRQKQQRKKPSLLRRLLLCCISDDGGDKEGYSLNGKKQTEAELRAAAAAVVEDTIARPTKTHGKDKRESRVLFETTPPTPPLPMMYPNRKQAASAVSKRPSTYGAMAAQGATPASGYFDPNADPATQFNAYIPPHLSQSTQARLRAELAKPFSDGEEPGYIYVFWLTDTPISPASTPGGKQTTAAALLKTAAAAESLPKNTAGSPRLLLKIGRANNVQRRLHEWSTQCGYNLSLVRFYPHVSASATPSPAGSRRTPGPPSTPFLHTLVGKKVPNSHRIERLIHLELRDEDGRNPEIECKACGKTHKEWFWIDATRDGLHGVDEIVKKWIDYGEKSAMVPGVPRTPGTKSGSTTPKKTKKADDATTPSRPSLAGSKQSASSGAGRNGRTVAAAAAAGSNHLSPGAGKRVAASPARSGKSNNASRPGSSAGKSPARGRGRKTYDDDEGSDEYIPNSDDE